MDQIMNIGILTITVVPPRSQIGNLPERGRSLLRYRVSSLQMTTSSSDWTPVDQSLGPGWCGGLSSCLLSMRRHATCIPRSPCTFDTSTSVLVFMWETKFRRLLERMPRCTEIVLWIIFNVIGAYLVGNLAMSWRMSGCDHLGNAKFSLNDPSNVWVSMYWDFIMIPCLIHTRSWTNVVKELQYWFSASS